MGFFKRKQKEKLSLLKHAEYIRKSLLVRDDMTVAEMVALSKE